MRTIRTYSLSERAAHPDFAIHDERAVSRIGQGHRHEYFQIQFNLEGRARYYIGAIERTLEPGGLSFVLPYRVHRVAHDPGSRFYIINFMLRFLRPELDIDPLDLEDVPLERAPELAPFLFQEFMDFRLEGTDLERAAESCRIMSEEDARRRFFSLEAIRAHLLLLITAVCRRHEHELLRLAAGKAQRRSRRDALSRIARYVRDNLTRRVSLAEVAGAVDLSPNYLAHLLKKETGRTFTDLVTERRMEKAQELLVHTTMRISEIAEAVGFEDEAYFARRFRQWFNAAPSEFRARAASAARRQQP